MEKIKKISSQTLWQILGKVVTSLSTFIVLGLVSRRFGPEGLGVFTLSLTFLAFFYLAADFGFNAHLLALLMESGGSLVWRKLLGLRLIWALLLLVLALLLSSLLPLNSPQFSQAVGFGVLAIFGSALFVSANALFQARLRYDLSVIASSLGTLLTLIITYLLINQGAAPPKLLLGHMLGWLLIGFLGLFLVRPFIRNIWPIFDWQFIRTTFHSSWPISLTLILNVVYFRADSFILSSTRSVAEVGIYNLAYSVFQSALVLPTFIMNSFYPMLLALLGNNPLGFKKFLMTGVIGMFSLGLLGTILTLVLSPFVITLISGGGFGGAAVSLRLLSLSFPAFFLSSLFMWVLVSLKRYKTLVFIYGAGLLANLILNSIFIPTSSYIGASIITVLSEYLILALQVSILFRDGFSNQH